MLVPGRSYGRPRSSLWIAQGYSSGARRFTYRREPYGRARIPTDLGELIVDGKVRATEDGPLLNLWRHCAGGRVLDVFIPAAWVRPIARDESAWIDVYDMLDSRCPDLGPGSRTNALSADVLPGHAIHSAGFDALAL